MLPVRPLLGSTRAWFAARPRRTDALVAALLFAATLISSRSLVDLFRVDGAPYPYDATKDAIGLALTVLPLALRRSAPLVSLVGCCVGFVLARQLLGSMESNMVTFVLALAFYSAAAHGRARVRAAVATGAFVVAMILVMGEIGYELSVPEDWPGAGIAFLVFSFAYNLALIVAMWVLGTLRASAVRRNAVLAERTTELVAERGQNARRAVLDERVRIARELHDVVAHHVSVIGVQAGAARTVLNRDPARAAEVLASIEGESRQAVSELQRLLGILRQSGDTDDLAPQPGLGQLATLTAAVEGSGIAVAVQVEGPERPLARTVDASAYRIVQESLTNAIKHSGATSARVRLRYGVDALELAIEDDGAGAEGAADPTPRASTAAGLGIVGMQERAALHGGTIDAGPRPGGGFAVRAWLPFAGALAEADGDADPGAASDAGSARAPVAQRGASR